MEEGEEVKSCTGCQKYKTVQEFSIRQWTKKFPKCSDCLTPKYESQKNLQSGNQEKCQKCGITLPNRIKSFCDRCEYSRQRRSEYNKIEKELEKDRQREINYQKKKMQELEMETPHLGIGIDVKFSKDGRKLYTAD